MRKKETVNTTHTQKSHNKKKFESEHFLLNRESSSFLITTFRYFLHFFLQTKAAEQYFLPVRLLIIWLFKAVLTVTIQMKAIEQYFPQSDAV